MSDGSFRMEWVFDRFGYTADKAEDVLLRAIEDVAEDALTTANQTVPIEEGILASSGVARADGGDFEVAYFTEYARVQHEDVTLRHDPGRRAKWLELTFQENEERWQRYIANQLRDGLR